jgi:Zn-dependent protease with chaperone function
MTHLGLIAAAITIAYLLRYLFTPRLSSQSFWGAALVLFIGPPLLLVITAVAIVVMGPSGQHMVHWEGWLSYGVALGFLLVNAIALMGLGIQTTLSLRTLQKYPLAWIGRTRARIVDTEGLLSAQVGFWQPELVVSQGLLDTLPPEQLQAVLAHEAAHHYYHDTFWGFWLGSLRRLTAWLPYTETLWQELCLGREMRADRWACQTVDALDLAEALVQVVANPWPGLDLVSVGFSDETVAPSRLARRIDALLNETPASASVLDIKVWHWAEVSLALTPLVMIPFHQ